MSAGMALINMMAVHQSVRKVYSCETREEALKLLTDLSKRDCAPDWPEDFHNEEFHTTQEDIEEVRSLILQTSDMSWPSACNMLKPLVDEILPPCPDVLKEMGFREASELAKNNPGPTVTRHASGKFISQSQQSQLKDLMTKGKEQSFLTYAQINDHLPDDIVDPKQLEDIINMINDMGIAVLEKAPDDEATDYEAEMVIRGTDTLDDEATDSDSEIVGKAIEKLGELAFAAQKHGANILNHYDIKIYRYLVPDDQNKFVDDSDNASKAWEDFVYTLNAVPCCDRGILLKTNSTGTSRGWWLRHPGAVKALCNFFNVSSEIVTAGEWHAVRLKLEFHYSEEDREVVAHSVAKARVSLFNKFVSLIRK